MKISIYCWLSMSMMLLAGCHWSEQETRPFYIKESAVFKFYNNGDSLLDAMTLSEAHFYRPVENHWGGTGYEYREKDIANPPIAWPYSSTQLYPNDSIIVSFGDIYIGCKRYAEFAVYYADSTAVNGYRLRGKYIVDDTIQQKYAIDEYKYPDATIVVNWPEDSLLFKL